MTDDSLIPSDLPGSRTVLVVDDAGVVRRLAYRLLSEAGYRVFEAGSAVEALEVVNLARGRLNTVLLDVVMPEVNGVDLARMLRERIPEAGIIFMSAYPAEVLAQEGLRDLQVRFLAKPFTREELLLAVANATESRSSKPDGEPYEVDQRGNA
jgi:two-component system cell cycle sensor histidine kinase/response regulator CckA